MTLKNLALQDRLDAFKADFVGGKLAFKPTKERLDAMARATAELIESGQAQRAKKAGDAAPEFSLKDPEGNPVTSRDLLSKGPLVISFYRGVWCPYCNLELQALQAALSQITARGVLGILDLAQYLAGALQEQRAGVGQRDAPRGAEQQRDAEPRLQLADDARDRRLRQRKLARGFGEAAAVGGTHENLQFLQPVTHL